MRRVSSVSYTHLDVYKRQVLKNVSKIYVEGSQVRLVDIMGAEVVVEGTISFVDLTGSVVKLNCPSA